MESSVLLLDSYDEAANQLRTSFRLAGYKGPMITMLDDGFLPRDVTSIYQYYLGVSQGKARYFNQIDHPKLWEIRGNNSYGEVYDKTHLRGRIVYAKPLEKRLVSAVEWLDEKGIHRYSDYYNSKGRLYSRGTMDAKGQAVLRSWFDSSGREVITENYRTGDILLDFKGRLTSYKSRVDFAVDMLKDAGYLDRQIYYNSLSTPFFVAEKLGSRSREKGAQDLLFWQEGVREDIPGNMKGILAGSSPSTSTVIVMNEGSYEKLLSLGADHRHLKLGGYVHGFTRENSYGRKALICTNSDQLEGIEELITGLPQIHFHIVAVTEMSKTLMDKEKYSNVTLYPGAKPKIIEELFQECDYYFDINYQNVIVNALERAFLANQLILGFEKTIHGRVYISKDQIKKNPEEMSREVEKTMENKEYLEECLIRQRKAGGDLTPAAFRELMK